MADKQVNIKINVDGKDAEKGVKQVQTSITGMKDKAGSAFNAMKGAWMGAVAGIAAGAVVLKKALDFAQVFSDFKEQADLLASNFGISSDKLIARVRAATNGVVSNIEIIKNATKAFALGSAKNIDDVAKMFQVAEVQGKTSGKSMEQAFDIITEAIGRNRPGMLTQIGISKDLIDSWEAQAKASGGVLDSQTLLNKVMEVGSKNLEKASAAGLSFGDKLKIIKATAENVKLAIGEGVVRSLDPMIDKIKEFASSETALKRVRDAVLLLSTAFQIVVDVLSLSFQAFRAFISPIVGFGKAVFDVFEKIKSGKATLQEIFNLDFLKEELKVAGKDITDSAEGIKNTIAGIGTKTKNAFKSITSPNTLSAGGEVSTGNINSSNNTRINDTQADEIRLQKLKSYYEKEITAKKKLYQDYQKELAGMLDAELGIINTQSLQKISQAQGDAEKIKEIEKDKEIQIDKTRAEYAQKEIERNEYILQSRLTLASQAINGISQIEQGFSSIFSGLSANRSQEMENEQILRTNAIQESLNQGLISEEEYATQKKAIDKDIAMKSAQQKRKDAEMNKGLKMFEIITSTASAIVNALATGGPPWLSIPLSVAIGALGAVQLGIAAAAPLPEIPAFAKGVRNFIGGAALVGEQGPEIVNLPMGSSVVPNSGLSSFNDTMNARAITAQSAGGNSYDNSRSTANQFGDIYVTANSPAEFFQQMQQYLRENQGIA